MLGYILSGRDDGEVADVTCLRFAGFFNLLLSRGSKYLLSDKCEDRAWMRGVCDVWTGASIVIPTFAISDICALYFVCILYFAYICVLSTFSILSKFCICLHLVVCLHFVFVYIWWFVWILYLSTFGILYTFVIFVYI